MYTLVSIACVHYIHHFIYRILLVLVKLLIENDYYLTVMRRRKILQVLPSEFGLMVGGVLCMCDLYDVHL